VSLSDLERIFGTEQLARFLGFSTTDLQRYTRGGITLSVVTARADFLQAVVDQLSGTYGEEGIRRWFERQRHLLDSNSPTELLSGDWDPDAPGPQCVRELARTGWVTDDVITFVIPIIASTPGEFMPR
jgi:hypothetical protein